MLPASLVATVFLCLSIGVFAFGVIKSNSESEEKSLLRVAYVGELSEYMGINLDSVINIISEEFGVDAYAPYSGTMFNLATNKFEHEAIGVRIAKAEKKKTVSAVFERLVFGTFVHVCYFS